ncbi:MAG: hypothetical protein HC902_15110, partial [Calothrix sp. SM1_5_4]|nr:hypothetical protein [Calothrix sp. SM1_5_4]
MEFRAFSSIVKMMSPCQITEKVHGTNAAVIVEFTMDGVPIVRAQSRTRLLLPEDDNYGFAGWVKKNEAELARCLGPGLHFGEWYGSGVNS